MSSSHTSGTPDSRRTGKVRRRAWGVAATTIVVLLTLQAVRVLSSSSYRRVIREADSVEIRAFIVNNVAGGVDIAKLTEKDDIQELADSFNVVGVWVPWDELIANSYRLRTIRNGVTTDIVIRGDRVKSGFWHARLSGVLFATIRDLVDETGGSMPQWLKILRGAGTQEPDMSSDSLEPSEE